MSVDVVELPPSALAAYARVPMSFEVSLVFDVTAPERGLGGLLLAERRVDRPYVKDYDALAAGGPERWPDHHDLSGWGLLAARTADVQIGGAAVAYDTGDVAMLDGRLDLAVLWDLRVAPAARRTGVATTLLRAAERWAEARGARWMKIETQNVNVPACRLYAGRGYELGAVHRHAYPELPEEVQLLWYKELAHTERATP